MKEYLLIPILLLGIALYYLSRLIRAAAYLLMLHPICARAEMTWTIDTRAENPHIYDQNGNLK